MKKILLLFFSAVVSFLAFSYLDQYDVLIAPFLNKDKDSYAELFNQTEEEGKIKDFLINFNDMLSAAYRSSEPSKVSDLPLSDDLKKSIMEECVFFRRSGRIMDMVLKELTVIKVDRLSPAAMQVKARERIGVRYLAGYEVKPYVESEQDVTYILIAGSDGLTVSSYEITFVKDFGKRQ